MAYLYAEVSSARKEELSQHLAQCATCGKQLHEWRNSLQALDQWELPSIRTKPFVWPPAVLLRWAVAAAVILVGTCAALQLNAQRREVAELKTMVTQLAERATSSSAAATAIETTRTELVQLLSDYAKLSETRRAEDRQVAASALRELDLRLTKLRTELETVALNTESSFQLTKADLTTLASYAAADHGEATALQNPNTKN